MLSADQEQPDVFPQPSQTKQLPAIRIFVPHVIHSGASDDCPLIFSKSSIDEPTPAVLSTAGLASIFTTAGAATGAATAFGAELSSCVYSPDSKARARSDAV